MTLRKIIIHCPLPEGGIAEHAHYQAVALHQSGVAVTMLTSPGFLPGQQAKPYRVRAWLLPPYLAVRSSLAKRLWFALAVVLNEWLLAALIVGGRFGQVLLGATSETLAPLTVWPHVLLCALGVRYAANIHDPQRKQRDGAGWWHRWSVRASFYPIGYGLIHEDFDPHQPQIPAHVQCLRVPYGCYRAAVRPDDGRDLRARIGAGADRHVFLAFGYIADRKNIDACVRSVAAVPQAVLLVAGRVASRHDKPVDFYRDLAAQLGCADRVHIFDGFVPDAMVAHYFGAADSVLLTYKPEFVSQSGVLLLASNWAKPVLASSGPGPLAETVRRFDLGPVVAADDIPATVAAMQALVAHGHARHGWEEFRAHASWVRNVAVLCAALDRGQGTGKEDR